MWLKASSGNSNYLFEMITARIAMAELGSRSMFGDAGNFATGTQGLPTRTKMFRIRMQTV